MYTNLYILRFGDPIFVNYLKLLNEGGALSIIAFTLVIKRKYQDQYFYLVRVFYEEKAIDTRIYSSILWV